MNDDITGKFVMHVSFSGIHHEEIRELTSLDLNSPVDDSLMKIPAKFAVENGKPSGVCASVAP
jgi:hypothetical protein